MLDHEKKHKEEAPADIEPIFEDQPTSESEEEMIGEQDLLEETYQDISPDDVKTLRTAMKQIADERDSYRDQMLVTMADFQNFRKRSESDRVAARQIAKESFVLDLLPVLDNFERSLKSLEAGASLESVLEGIRAMERQLKSTLERHNVVKIPAEGLSFDPELHEAIASVATDEHPENTVVQEIESGYKLSDKVIRPSRVKVSTKP